MVFKSEKNYNLHKIKKKSHCLISYKGVGNAYLKESMF